MLTWLYRRFATDLGHEIARSVREDKWTTGGGYYLKRADGRVEIWIANAAYALRVSIRPDGKDDDWSMLCDEFRPSWADRHLIWSEVRRLRVPSPEQCQYQSARKALGFEEQPE